MNLFNRKKKVDTQYSINEYVTQEEFLEILSYWIKGFHTNDDSVKDRINPLVERGLLIRKDY